MQRHVPVHKQQSLVRELLAQQSYIQYIEIHKLPGSRKMSIIVPDVRVELDYYVKDLPRHCKAIHERSQQCHKDR